MNEKDSISISDYRNKVVGHNIANAPKLTFDINEADFVLSTV